MTRSPLTHACAALFLGLASLPVAAQLLPLSTTAGLKAACEGHPGHVVRVTSSVTVSVGSPADYPEQVRSACRIELIGGAGIQFDKVGLAFAGPLVIVGGSKSELQMQEAALAARHVRLDLSGEEGGIKMDRSRVDATTGALEMALGTKAKLEVIGWRDGGEPRSRAAWAARGKVMLSTSKNLTAGFKDTGIVAGTGVDFRIFGVEVGVVLENTGIHAAAGDVSIELNSSKSKLEAQRAQFTAPAGRVALGFSGGETGMMLGNSSLPAGASVVLAGQGPKAEVQFSEGSIRAGTGVRLEAGLNHIDGLVQIARAQVDSGAAVQVLSGARGKTMVFDSRIGAAGDAVAATDVLGTCEAKDNQVAAARAALCR